MKYRKEIKILRQQIDEKAFKTLADEEINDSARKWEEPQSHIQTFIAATF